MFVHSRRDAILVALTMVQIAFIAIPALFFDRFTTAQLIVLGVIGVLGTNHNYHCIAHNFLHNRFFRSRLLNRLFAAANSIVTASPVSLYEVQHFNHHRYTNDRRDPETGLCGDFSSTYAHPPRDGDVEPIWKYSVLGTFRHDTVAYAKVAAERHGWAQVVFELVPIVGLSAAALILDWRGFVFYLLPVWLAGQTMANAENYQEHRGADPTNPLANSVSCYNRLYNALFFNNGYHQEHHYRPATHWTEVPNLREAMLPESQRPIARGAHIFGRIDRPAHYAPSSDQSSPAV